MDHAERFVRTVRTECLDWLLILGRRQLQSVMRSHIQHYKTERLIVGIALPATRSDTTEQSTGGAIRRHDHLGGLLREYSAA